MKYLIVFIVFLLLLPICFAEVATRNNIVYDDFIMGATIPNAMGFSKNISGYKPIIVDGKVKVQWYIFMQTGVDRSVAGTINSITSYNAPSGYVAYIQYKYTVSFWVAIWDYLKHFFDDDQDKIIYPFIPPIVFTKFSVDCNSDGRTEYYREFYNGPTDNEELLKNLQYTIYPYFVQSHPNVLLKPPIPTRTLVATCYYPYNSASKYGFNANMTVNYHLEPNYYSNMVFSQDNYENLYPGYILTNGLIEGSLIIAGVTNLSQCGDKGQKVFGCLHKAWFGIVCPTGWKNYWLPSDKPGCDIPITYRIGTNGFLKPVGQSVVGSSHVSTNDTRPESLETPEDCYNYFERTNPGKLKECLSGVAAKEMRKQNNLFDMGLSIIRMMFSFIMLLFYIFSITIIGYVFATLIPGIFSKIQLVFRRATRLQ